MQKERIGGGSGILRCQGSTGPRLEEGAMTKAKRNRWVERILLGAFVLFSVWLLSVVGAWAFVLRTLFLGLGVLVAATWFYARFSSDTNEDLRWTAANPAALWLIVVVLAGGGAAAFKRAAVAPESAERDRGESEASANSDQQAEAEVELSSQPRRDQRGQAAAESSGGPAAPTGRAVGTASVDCKALVEDVAFLSKIYERVRVPGYPPTEKNCKAITKEIDGRFAGDWREHRGLTERAEADEPKLADAVQTFAITCTNIVMAFACDGEQGIRQKHGAEIVKGYERDFERYSNDLKSRCTAKMSKK